MFTSNFIAQKMKFGSKLSIIASAISFFVIIISVAISSGFSYEIRKEIATLCGDVIISNSYADYYSDLYPISISKTKTSYPNVISSTPAIYRTAIVQKGGQIDGVVFKGINTDKDSLRISIPQSLAIKLGVNQGDSLKSYFISENIAVEEFIVDSVYNSSLMESSDKYFVFANLSDLQAINYWNEDEASVIEFKVESKIANSKNATENLCQTIADESELAVFSSRYTYSDLFDWLEMIEYNVKAIILLMSIVAGFNMISGLLILIFKNTSTIGKLKTMGMRNSTIASIFLQSGARITAIGLAIGNILALLFCFIQSSTHILKLNPEHYFVSFVPISIDLKGILLADFVSFAAIMLLLLLPLLLISRIDPSTTVKAE